MGLNLTSLGIFHTLIGIVALIIALISLFKEGEINPKNSLGRTYIMLTLVTSVTSFGIMKTGHLSPSHFLTVLILIILPIAIYAPSIKVFGKKAQYVQTLGMTATLHLSFIPTIVETLTRVPVGHPLAVNQESPIIMASVGMLTLVFVVIAFFQWRAINSHSYHIN
jgi:uncharacterized membrane protein